MNETERNDEMISVNDFRTGLTIEVEGNLWQVVEFQHVKPGKGAAFVRSKLRNMRTGAIQDKTFRGGEKVNQAHIDKRNMQYLYASGDMHAFMDNDTFEQIELPSAQITDELNYLKDNMQVEVLMYESETLGIQLPNTVELEVVETDPSIKGNTVSGGSKPAKLDTGLTVQVPMFINQGDRLVIDTRKGEYVSRS